MSKSGSSSEIRTDIQISVSSLVTTNPIIVSKNRSTNTVLPQTDFNGEFHRKVSPYTEFTTKNSKVHVNGNH